MNGSRRRLIRVIAPLAMMALIFYFSAQPAGPDHPWWEIIFRKLGHVTGYALLTVLWFWALQGLVRRPLLWAVAISFAYACSDELHQTFVHGRNGTPVDVGVDAIGMAIAAGLISAHRLSPRLRGRVGPGGETAARSSPAR